MKLILTMLILSACASRAPARYVSQEDLRYEPISAPDLYTDPIAKSHYLEDVTRRIASARERGDIKAILEIERELAQYEKETN